MCGRLSMWTCREGTSVPRILVADDNTNIQKMVALAFEERGIDVVSVGNGEAAVRRIPDLSPDLVLADVFMPVRNGYEVCEFVKKDERFAHVPVILLVGAFDPLDEKEARRVGADGVLKKPFVPPDPLIAMVTSALEKNPKVAAEMARARETALAPPPPVEPSSPLLDAPARIQPKPLPEFPEPSPEEAALIYGFGKGRRGSDKEEAPPKRTTSTEAEEAEEQEEFEGGLTASDWRRKAGNFEVPPELARKPAFAGVEDFHPEMFPSERDVPPKRIHVQEEEEEASAPVARAEVDQPIESAPPVEPTVPVEPEIDIPKEASARNGEPPTSPAPSADRQPVPSAVREPGDWMDATAPSPSEYDESGWISKILGSQGAAKNAQKEEAAKEQPASLSGGQEKQAIDAPEKQQASEPVSQAEEPFFAPSEPATESWFAPAPPVLLESAESPQIAPSSPEPAASSVRTPADAPVAEPGDTREAPATTPASSDPSVLSSDRTADPPGGAMHKDPSSPFSAPESAEPLLARHDEDSLGDESNSSIFTPSSPSSGAQESSERIPTLPPPNREALREIPFLTPPPPSPLEMNSDRAKDSPSVDAVVAKVLEKLGPQLHDLLAEGVLKPLVENLLQNEDPKKQK
jgi:CheY-like chemotaxis protein